MVIECKHVWAHISGYLDQTLPPDVREQVEKHLAHCEICSAILRFDSEYPDSSLRMSGCLSFRLVSANGCTPGWRKRSKEWLRSGKNRGSLHDTSGNFCRRAVRKIRALSALCALWVFVP